MLMLIYCARKQNREVGKTILNVYFGKLLKAYMSEQKNCNLLNYLTIAFLIGLNWNFETLIDSRERHQDGASSSL